MAGTPQGRPGGIIEGINMTPLVDIMLVLLVIFIVTAKILVTPSMPLDLPSASQAEDVQVIFAVTIPAKGGIEVNGQPVAGDDGLRAKAKEALASDPDVRAVIQADGQVPHAQVIATLDVLRQAGLSRVAFATQPPQGAPAP